ncbi:MAG: mechanosensitive ion channel domain-containing protein [Stellaceae bacterium]
MQVGASVGIVKELSLFWTKLMTDGKVQIIVPNGGVWGQPLRNLSIYPPPPPVLEMRFRIAESTELAPAIESVRAIVEAHPRVLSDLAPSVLLDHSGSDNAIEILVTCSTVEGEAAAVRTDLIRAVQTALDHDSGKLAAQ